MRCVTPMFRKYRVGNYKEGHVVSRKEVMQGLLNFDPNYIDYCLRKMNTPTSKFRYETIPCGHCYACQLNYSAEWATRLTYECQKYQHNYFVTLTFNNNWLPVNDKIVIGDVTYKYPNDPAQQVLWNEGTVWEPYMHKFLHDLRQYLKRKKHHQGLKYFYCMEYGSETHRPHAHIILMNCPLNIDEFYDFYIDENYKAHWKSNEIEQFWRYGIIDIAEAEWSSCAYVARYCMKKLHTKNVYEYAEEGKLPEFIRMSRNIGRDYYERNKLKIYEYDEVIMKTVKGNTGAFKPPKAWDKRFKEEFPDKWTLIRESRKTASERSRKLKKELSDYTDSEQIQMDFEKVTIKMKSLPREGDW